MFFKAHVILTFSVLYFILGTFIRRSASCIVFGTIILKEYFPAVTLTVWLWSTVRLTSFTL